MTIIIVIIIWAIIIIINYLLGHQQQQPVLESTYEPHKSTLKSEFEVPEKLHTPIEDLIDDYITKCNNKDFDGAYKLLTDDCKKYAFDDSFDNYVEYANTIFKSKKIYSIQDYRNYGKYYIYDIKILDDILATGLTNQEYATYTEKMAISKNGDKLQLCVNDYMGHSELKKFAEDDNTKIRIESRDEYYEFEIYTIKITNKTDKYLVIYDKILGNEMTISSGNDTRGPTNVSSLITLIPEETKTFEVTFPKYYDEKTKEDTISFNKIRIMTDYTGEEKTEEEQQAKTEQNYGIEIAL